MAKKINSPSAKNKEKAVRHRSFTKKAVKEISNTFAVNNLIDNPKIAGLDDFELFTFVITIAKTPGITIKAIDVNGVQAKDSDIEIKADTIVCKLKAFISTFSFLLVIDAEGDPLLETTFNLTCDEKKVFDEDQKIVITASGRGAYSNPKVPLP